LSTVTSLADVTYGRSDRAKRIAELERRLVDELKPLARVAYNLRWSWIRRGGLVFAEIDPHRWRLTGRNPVKFLWGLHYDRQLAVAADSNIVQRVNWLAHELDSPPARRQAPGPAYDGTVAYFSAEFGVHASLPGYSGGLGVLAGDVLKEASDRGLQMVGVGIFYRRGYFVQRLDLSGTQQEYWLDHDPAELPMALVNGHDGEPLKLAVTIFGRELAFQVWCVEVGSVSLLLLDAELPENDPVARWTTARTYDGNPHVRLAQYGLLGMGGARVLDALGIRPDVVHLNEGHPALAALEQASADVAAGVPLDEALDRVRRHVVFTTHTPLQAGNESYPPDQFLDAFGELARRLGISDEAFLDLCRVGAGEGEPGMSQLAMRLSNRRNGVSRRHGELAREMWMPMFPGAEAGDVPVDHVTNGAHLATYLGDPMYVLLARHLGERWLRNPADPEAWAPVRHIPNDELWRARTASRRRLAEFAQQKAEQDRLLRGEQLEYVRAGADLLDVDTLTLGFARRLASYKRLSLLVADPERARALLTGPRPVQVLIAGKAHPRDADGKRLLERLFELRDLIDPDGGRVAFLEDYDLALGRQMVAGCDVWINLPRPPLEASGTSGMKAMFNGCLHLSVLDGWWAEGYNGRNGWAITGDPNPDLSLADRADAEALYSLIEHEVIPLFYERDADGIPHGWCDKIKEALVSCGPTFTTARMMDEYVTRIYTQTETRGPFGTAEARDVSSGTG
jgi:starch phosphorylase